MTATPESGPAGPPLAVVVVLAVLALLFAAVLANFQAAVLLGLVALVLAVWRAAAPRRTPPG